MENLKNVAVVGIDVGNLTTIVTCEEKTIIFESRVEIADELLKLGGTNEVISLGNEEYIIGQGSFEKDKYKYRKDNFIKLLFYGISKITDKDQIKLVTGIPAGQYATRKEEMKKVIEDNNSKIIEIYEDGQKTKRNIYIEEIVVVPESYGIKTLEIIKDLPTGKDTLIVDIGGGTTDIAEFGSGMKFQGGSSINKGLTDMYSKVRIHMEDALEYNIPLENVSSYVDGKKEFHADKEIIEHGILKFYKEWLNELKTYYEIKSYNVILAGGGSAKLYSNFRKEYPETLIVSDVRANAIGFKAIGKKMWQNI